MSPLVVVGSFPGDGLLCLLDAQGGLPESYRLRVFVSLADFSVTTHPDPGPPFEDIKGNTEAGKHWFLADLSVVDGFRATVALERSYSRLETYAWT